MCDNIKMTNIVKKKSNNIDDLIWSATIKQKQKHPCLH